MTVGLGIILCFVFPTDPERTRYLTEAERELAIKRIYADQPQVCSVDALTSNGDH